MSIYRESFKTSYDDYLEVFVPLKIPSSINLINYSSGK